ncbi:MAG: hypothetical protein ABI741_11810 [Ferruginibacter sp.]
MQDLFLQLFNKNIDDAGSESMLRDITKEYPYFTAPHFYLLKKTRISDHGYDKITAMAALHFDNPFLLKYRLNKAKVEEIQLIEKVEEVKIVNASEIEAVKAEVEGARVETKDEEMIFEPLFASDYFASQGIKLSEEVQPGDKLGKQLKSFTEWLKSMKKVHEMKASGGNEQIDLAVQNLAEKSNQETDILTESMAEAYLQQGKLKKARETLEKLSLLNPAKSAYFAAKIENIHLEQ